MMEYTMSSSYRFVAPLEDNVQEQWKIKRNVDSIHLSVLENSLRGLHLTLSQVHKLLKQNIVIHDQLLPILVNQAKTFGFKSGRVQKLVPKSKEKENGEFQSFLSELVFHFKDTQTAMCLAIDGMVGDLSTAPHYRDISLYVSNLIVPLVGDQSPLDKYPPFKFRHVIAVRKLYEQLAASGKDDADGREPPYKIVYRVLRRVIREKAGYLLPLEAGEKDSTGPRHEKEDVKLKETYRKYMSEKDICDYFKYVCRGWKQTGSLKEERGELGDFDGDEVNGYFIPNAQSEAECATLLNPE